MFLLKYFSLDRMDICGKQRNVEMQETCPKECYSSMSDQFRLRSRTEWFVPRMSPKTAKTQTDEEKRLLDTSGGNNLATELNIKM